MPRVAGIPAKLLGDGEEVVMAMRPHWKEMVGPAVVLLLVSPVATYLAAIVPDGSAQTWGRLAIAVVAVLVVMRWSAWPFLKWQTTSNVVTARSFFTRY
jgi:hypothetical protein